ncbi:hypothetical protein EMIT0111MI5_90003 [Burkholderia sp. IT-111MI5]
MDERADRAAMRGRNVRGTITRDWRDRRAVFTARTRRRDQPHDHIALVPITVTAHHGR